MKRTDYEDIVRRALAEDLGGVGDITGESVIDPDGESLGVLESRAGGIVAGLEVAACAFDMVDDSVVFEATVAEGARIESGDPVATVRGPTRSILASERTALNILGRMSGVASATSRYVDAIAGSGAAISDTRKTMPGLRMLDKYAVVVGGGVNHRMGLFDAVMIKDNHIAASGSIEAAVRRARAAVGPEVMIEVEVETLEQLEEVLRTEADRVLLDNMGVADLSRAVSRARGRLETEASGGITLDNVSAVAATGVDIISVGWITHSSPQLDIGLDFLS